MISKHRAHRPVGCLDTSDDRFGSSPNEFLCPAAAPLDFEDLVGGLRSTLTLVALYQPLDDLLLELRLEALEIVDAGLGSGAQRTPAFSERGFPTLGSL